MSFALKYGSVDGPEDTSGLIYFDAVTQYGRDFSGQLSSHPLANGTQISDHYTRQNPKYNLSAVISGVDLSTWTYLIQDSDWETPINVYDNESVSITAPDEGMVKFLPDLLGQFFEPGEPEIRFDKSRTDFTPLVEEALIRLMQGFVYDQANDFWRSNVQLVTLLEWDGVILKNRIPDLVITNMSFQEDVNSGDSLVVNMALEQVTYAAVRATKLDQTITRQFADQAAAERRMSNADSTESPEVEDRNIDRTGVQADKMLEEKYGRDQTNGS